jgi:hypothetical protein
MRTKIFLIIKNDKNGLINKYKYVREIKILNEISCYFTGRWPWFLQKNLIIWIVKSSRASKTFTSKSVGSRQSYQFLCSVKEKFLMDNNAWA